MPEIQKNNAEADFHRRRKAFVILECAILMAQDGFEGSHGDLLLQSGFDQTQTQDIIKNYPRGYALNGNVYLYQSNDFSCVSPQNQEKIKKYLSFFKKSDLLDQNGKIYDGMHLGKTGDQWTPRKEFKISF